MISTNKVLTAAHCLYSSDGGGYATAVSVSPGHTQTSNPYGTVKASSWQLNSLYNVTSAPGGTGADSDIAIITLPSNLGQKTGFLYLSAASVGTTQQLTIAGYTACFNSNELDCSPSGVQVLGNMYVAQGTLDYSSSSTDLLYYHIDISYGDSGAPVLNSSNHIIGVVSLMDNNSNYAVEVAAHQSFLGDYILCPTGEANVYRLYNPNNGDHFLTTNTTERDSLVKAGWNYEGVKMCQPTSGTAVYRLNNPTTGEHFYTTNANERTSLVNSGWKYEQVAFYGAASTASGAMPVYRLFNPNAKGKASHFFTVTASEKDSLVKSGWKLESSAAWYALKKSF
jgi:V8-like Glu-specific endopeptidase